MMIKLFSDKISPHVHDGAARKEGFGMWREQFLYTRSERRERTRRAEIEMRDAMLREEMKKERLVHAKTRSDMVIKLFAEKISPGIHDIAAKKEGFGAWKEGFLRESYRNREKQRRKEEEKWRNVVAEERTLHNKSRGDMIIKLFSEKISPAVHDVAAAKEGFGVWKEDFLHDSYTRREAQKREEVQGWQDEIAKEREVHAKTRSDMMIKLFSEKISPAVHDLAAVKEV
jgi:hypothetical protein